MQELQEKIHKISVKKGTKEGVFPKESLIRETSYSPPPTSSSPNLSGLISQIVNLSKSDLGVYLEKYLLYTSSLEKKLSSIERKNETNLFTANIRNLNESLDNGQALKLHNEALPLQKTVDPPIFYPDDISRIIAQKDKEIEFLREENKKAKFVILELREKLNDEELMWTGVCKDLQVNEFK